MTGFVLNMTEFVLNMNGFVLNMTGFVLNMTGFVVNMTGCVLNMTGFVLNMTGFVLNMTGFVLNMTGFILINLALIVVKQLWWRKRNSVPERLGDPGSSGSRTPTSQVEGAGPGSPIISVFRDTPLFLSVRNPRLRKRSEGCEQACSLQLGTGPRHWSKVNRVNCSEQAYYPAGDRPQTTTSKS